MILVSNYSDDKYALKEGVSVYTWVKTNLETRISDLKTITSKKVGAVKEIARLNGFKSKVAFASSILDIIKTNELSRISDTKALNEINKLITSLETEIARVVKLIGNKSTKL